MERVVATEVDGVVTEVEGVGGSEGEAMVVAAMVEDWGSEGVVTSY